MKLKHFLPLLLMLVLFSNTANAGENISARSMNETQSAGYAEKNVRGEFLAEGSLTMSNLGGGYIGIYIQTLTHKPVDKIRMRVYLDILNPETSQWETVNYYDFTYLKEDVANGDLSDPYEDFKVLGKKNNYYRLRGIHMVWLNGDTESFNTTTDGLLITR